MSLNWKTIEKLEAKVPGQEKTSVSNYRGMVEFTIQIGRYSTPLGLIGEDKERFRIENKELDIAVEAATLGEAKQLLREKLAASEDYSGTWKLFVCVDVDGGFSDGSNYGEEYSTCTIKTRYFVELSTKGGGKTRKRHMHLTSQLPNPFVGEFPKPATHKELSRLREGPAIGDHERKSGDMWIEATPELVATLRALQTRLGESGDRVREALSKKKFLDTIASLQSGGRLLSTSILQAEK